MTGRRIAAFLCLLWMVLWAGMTVHGAANNPDAHVLRIEGADPTGQLGYPISVVGAVGADPLAVTATGSGNFNVIGTKTNNAAAPLGTNIGALGVLANASAPSWTEGNLVTLSSDLSGNLRVGTHAVTESGTWTVQPGNTANTTAWKVDGSAVTQPVSGTFWQATQPVSIATMPSTPVTGTFWQATQPVSGTVTANQPSGLITGLTSANDTAGGRTGSDIIWTYGKGCRILVDTSTPAGTGSLTTVNIQMKDSLAAYRTIATFTVSLSSAGYRTYLIYPAAAGPSDTAVLNTELSNATLRVTTTSATDNAGNNITYNIDLAPIP
jgi:hypothetical protein